LPVDEATNADLSGVEYVDRSAFEEGLAAISTEYFDVFRRLALHDQGIRSDE
jgi:hypothetical protein